MERKDRSMESRLLLAFLLTGAVLLVSQYLFSPVPAPTAPQTAAKPQEPAKTGAPSPGAALPPQAPVEIPGRVQAETEERFTVETDAYRVVFSNRGAVVRSWILKAYQGQDGKELDLVYQRAPDKVSPPFSVVFKGQALATDPNTALFRVERTNGDLHLTFEFSDGVAATRKTFRFARDSYLTEVTSEVSQNGVRIPHALAWRGGFGDSTVINPASHAHAVYYDLANAKLTENEAKVAKEGPVSVSGPYSFAGLDDHYFAGVFLPAARSPVELTTFADSVPDKEGKDEPRVGASVGGEGLNRFSFYAGPKDADLLRRVDPKLEQLIDWGTWFGFLARPLFLALKWTEDRVTHNYGWAIVALTVAINLALFPLRLTSLKSAKKMQRVQPEISAITAKIKGLPLKDPRRAELQQEQMALYKKHGVNPFGGCLPMLAQIPVLFAFYTVLSVAIELRGSRWLWIEDLSQPEPYFILVILMVVSQFFQQKMTPTPGMDPAQQKIMLFMPLLFGYMFYLQPAGLVLYWLTGNLVSIAFQLILNRFTAAPVPAPAPATPPARKRRS